MRGFSRVPSASPEVNPNKMTEPVPDPSTPLRRSVLRRLTIAQLSTHLARFTSADPRFVRALKRDPRDGVQRLAVQLQARQAAVAREAARLDGLFALEREHLAQGFTVIAGVDEVGVAPLAGPVVAAAVILPAGVSLPELDDSKRLTAAQRDALYAQITACAVAFRIGMATVEEIDRLNILQATRLAHRRAILGLPVRPQLALIDGLYAADVPVPQLVIVDGDATCASIAAASVVAKVTRDRMMTTLGREFPHYGFDRHKGYGTKEHRAAIRRYGVTPAHRRSFHTVRAHQELLQLRIADGALRIGRA